MGRAHNLHPATDRFATVMGVRRGRRRGRASTGVRELLGGTDSASARREVKRLRAAVRGGQSAEALDVLRIARRHPPAGPLTMLADAVAQQEIARMSADTHEQVRDLLDNLNFRTRYPEHIVGEVAWGAERLHLCRQPNYESRVGDSVRLVCGRVLDANSHTVTSRGVWKAQPKVRCAECAAHAVEFEETGESENYPPLSKPQAAAVLDAACQALSRQLTDGGRADFSEHGQLEAAAASCYRQALTQLLAREFCGRGEWPFIDGVLDSDTYERVLILAEQRGRRQLAGLLTVDDWESILDPEVRVALPIPGDSNPSRWPLQKRVASALKARLNAS